MDFPKDLFKNNHYAILGLGKNGIAASQRLLQMGATIQVWDDQPKARQQIPEKLKPHLAPFKNLENFNALILSPGIPHFLPKPHPVAELARMNAIPILSDAEILYQAIKKSGSRARFVAITGTNGKSTTTVLLNHILTEAKIPSVAGGNLGPASLSLPYLENDGVYILEMSSYMLERLSSFKADIACLLNITPDHIERHGDMKGYVQAKYHIFDHQNQQDMAVIGIEDDYCKSIAKRLVQNDIPVKKISGKKDINADFWVDQHLLQDKKGIIADLNQARLLPGQHNAQNAAAATAMALALGVARQQIAESLNSFNGLAHRQRPVATIDSVTFINDSKATNADATSKALTCYNKIVWIAGGLAKAKGIDDLAPYFSKIKFALLIGKDAPLLAKTLDRYHVHYQIVHTLDQAVPLAFAFAKQHHIHTVMLSPACASFDQFDSFEERGNVFIQLVNQLETSFRQTLND